MQITVKTPEGKSIPLTVKPTDTVQDVKKQVANKENIPIDDQRLQFNGKPLNDDSKTLDDLGINHGDTIPMEGMQIHVKDWNGKTATYDVTPSDTLQDIKDQVSRRQGIPVKQQRIVFDNRPLKDDNKTLKQYGIKHQDTLELLPMQITVKTPEGIVIPLIVQPTDTIYDIKKRVEDIESIPVDEHRLQFNGKPLNDDSKTLADLGITHDDKLFMGKKAKNTPTSPRKSYLPENWKEERERFGELITTTYEIDHNVDTDESFIRGKVKEEREKFKFDTRRKSEQK